MRYDGRLFRVAAVLYRTADTRATSTHRVGQRLDPVALEASRRPERTVAVALVAGVRRRRDARVTLGELPPGVGGRCRRRLLEDSLARLGVDGRLAGHPRPRDRAEAPQRAATATYAAS